jgi:hypothetical protein
MLSFRTRQSLIDFTLCSGQRSSGHIVDFASSGTLSAFDSTGPSLGAEAVGCNGWQMEHQKVTRLIKA